jgi:hypothetical protein
MCCGRKISTVHRCDDGGEYLQLLLIFPANGVDVKNNYQMGIL